ncbi:MAG: hypothetical protein IJ031_03000, partial [Oscillospiraceae bacterium]|nr:hypothetical protein [Oscillospiraceae bacterium]
ITFLIGMKVNSIQDDIDDTQQQINEANEQVEEYSKYNDILIKLTDYKLRVDTAVAALETKPIITEANFKNIDKYFAANNATYKSIAYNIAGTISISDITLPTQKDPRQLVETLVNCGKYADVSYSGWTEAKVTENAVIEGEDEEGNKVEIEVEVEDEDKVVYKISSMTLTLLPGEETEDVSTITTDKE